ncbi:hypothetical protein C0Q70_12911 [Pomacea canaliculata]|uniref:G-protein coupled receptors family 1 profile domain-containing protein n=1 Tax=Pomacea canaliculata TaxID=400727 RepID=A0A2T7P2T8_POMCA|nr:hypothetical protein C0Q70_12911 [Pomacea canaliculata]
MRTERTLESTYEGKYASGIWDCRNGLLHRRVWPADDLLRTDIYRIYQQKKRLLRAGQGVTNKCKFFGQQNVHTEKRKGTALVKTPAVSRDQGVFITSESSDSCASDGTKESSCSQNVENIAVTDFTTNQKQEKPCDVSDARGCTAVSEDVAKSLIVTTTIGSPNRNDEDKSREEDTSRSFAHGRQSVEQGQKRKPFMSRTTLMMFVLTVATLLFCVPPNFAVMLANVQYRSVHNSSWKINLYFLARFIPTLNSVINPFIYSFCNPKFRLQCPMASMSTESIWNSTSFQDGNRTQEEIDDYLEKPLETDVPGITGSTCDNLDTSVGIRVKRAFGFVLMSYFTVGFVLLAASYIQISHRVYQQKKKLARQTNLNSNSHAMKTQLNKTSESISESAGPSDTNTPGSDVTSKSVTVSEESTSSPDQEESLLVKKTRNGGEDIRRVEASNFGQDPEITVSPLVTSPPVPEASDLSKGGDTRSFLGDCPRDTTATPLHPETSKKTENGCRCRKGETANPGSNHQDGKPRQQKRAHPIVTRIMIVPRACVPRIAKLEYVNVGLSAWTLNLNFLARFFPIINSVINPFIYSFCNSKFRLQCRQFFTKVRNFFCTQV